MDFNVKKLVKDAGAALNRVVQVRLVIMMSILFNNFLMVINIAILFQLTEEKLGTAEKTELDAHFENLSDRAEVTKQWTEKIVWKTESVLIPNPGNRIEDFIFEKIEKKRPNRLSNIEYLGLDMVEAGNEFGPGTAYGSALIKVGQCEQKLGQTERDFIGSAALCFTQPLRKFLEGEMKTIIKEKGLLESKRLCINTQIVNKIASRQFLGEGTK